MKNILVLITLLSFFVSCGKDEKAKKKPVNNGNTQKEIPFKDLKVPSKKFQTYYVEPDPRFGIACTELKGIVKIDEAKIGRCDATYTGSCKFSSETENNNYIKHFYNIDPSLVDKFKHSCIESGGMWNNEDNT